ncbi:ATP synthase subunit I [Bradyrhizobium sp.]|uniref:ATP synthase subunit I n=1 Tax=Bradyrhizobium sp. TaxID=376 RepID=UPI003C6270B7
MTISFAAIGGMMVQAAAWLATGVLLGLLHFHSLRMNVRCLIAGEMLASLSLQLLRFAVTAAGLTLIARELGALPLIEAAIGLLIARSAVLRRELRQP